MTSPLEHVIAQLGAMPARPALASFVELEARTVDLLHDRAIMRAWFRGMIEDHSRRVIAHTPRYLVVAQRASPGTASDIHDHKTWGMHAVWRGQLREERFSRVTTARGMVLRRALAVTLVRGGIAWFGPPPADIHHLRSEGDEPTLSLHLYGAARPADHFAVRSRASTWNELHVDVAR